MTTSLLRRNAQRCQGFPHVDHQRKRARDSRKMSVTDKGQSFTVCECWFWPITLMISKANQSGGEQAAKFRGDEDGRCVSS